MLSLVCSTIFFPQWNDSVTMVTTWSGNRKRKLLYCLDRWSNCFEALRQCRIQFLFIVLLKIFNIKGDFQQEMKVPVINLPGKPVILRAITDGKRKWFSLADGHWRQRINFIKHLKQPWRASSLCMAGNTELLDVYTGRFKVLVVDKSGTGRRSKKAIVNVSTMVTDITSRH